MTDAKDIRDRIALIRAHAANVDKCCDEAEEAVRTGNDAKLRVYGSMLYDQAGHLRTEAKRAAQAVDRMPLDGLLRASLHILQAASQEQMEELVTSGEVSVNDVRRELARRESLEVANRG